MMITFGQALEVLSDILYLLINSGTVTGSPKVIIRNGLKTVVRELVSAIILKEFCFVVAQLQL